MSIKIKKNDKFYQQDNHLSENLSLKRHVFRCERILPHSNTRLIDHLSSATYHLSDATCYLIVQLTI